MRLEINPPVVQVTLSRRNLLTLLAKLDGNPPNSHKTIIYETAGEILLHVTAEEDDVHYAHPERDAPYAGPMHPDTERAIR